MPSVPVGATRHEAGQLDYEVAGAYASKRGGHQVIEVRHGVPRDGCGLGAMLDAVQELRSRVRVRTPVEGDVYQHVGVEKDHLRYFSASVR